MNPFTVLGLRSSFDVDLRALERTHRDLARALHPDRHAGAAPTQRKEALSRAVEVNEAYRVVRDPVRRAEALFALGGVATGENHEPKPSATLLMELMELREALGEARATRDPEAVRRLDTDVRARATSAEAALAQGFAAALAGTLTGASPNASALELLVPKLGELRFYRRFLEEVSAIEELLDQAHVAGSRDAGLGDATAR